MHFAPGMGILAVVAGAVGLLVLPAGVQQMGAWARNSTGSVQCGGEYRTAGNCSRSLLRRPGTGRLWHRQIGEAGMNMVIDVLWTLGVGLARASL